MKTISIIAWAKKNGVTRQRVYQWITAGRLKFIRENSVVLKIPEDEPRPDAISHGRPRLKVAKCKLNEGL